VPHLRTVPAVGDTPTVNQTVEMDDPGPRLWRWRLIERLVQLAAPADAQLSYLAGAQFMGQAIWDLATYFWEWTDPGLPAMVDAGVVPPNVAGDVEQVVAVVRAIRDADDVAWGEQGSNWFRTAEGLASDPLWAEVRLLAQTALDGFAQLGLPIPTLNDPDFNTPREDAP
jgi:hypothetical protein